MKQGQWNRSNQISSRSHKPDPEARKYLQDLQQSQLTGDVAFALPLVLEVLGREPPPLLPPNPPPPPPLLPPPLLPPPPLASAKDTRKSKTKQSRVNLKVVERAMLCGVSLRKGSARCSI